MSSPFLARSCSITAVASGVIFTRATWDMLCSSLVQKAETRPVGRVFVKLRSFVVQGTLPTGRVSASISDQSILLLKETHRLLVIRNEHVLRLPIMIQHHQMILAAEA